MAWCGWLIFVAGLFFPLVHAKSAYGVQTSLLTAAILYPDAPIDQTFVISYDDVSLKVDARQGFPQEINWPTLSHSDLQVTITPSVDPPISLTIPRKTLPVVAMDGWAFVQQPRAGFFQFAEPSFPCLHEELPCYDFMLQLECTNCELSPDDTLHGNFSSLMEQLESLELVALDTKSTATLRYRLTDTLNKVAVQDTVILEVYSSFTGLSMEMPSLSQMIFQWDPVIYASPYTSAEMPSIALQCSEDKAGSAVIFTRVYDIAVTQVVLTFDGPFFAPVYCSLRLTQPGWKDGPLQSFDMSNLRISSVGGWTSVLASPQTKNVLALAIFIMGAILVKMMYDVWASSSKPSSQSLRKHYMRMDAGFSPEFAEVFSPRLLRESV